MRNKVFSPQCGYNSGILGQKEYNSINSPSSADVESTWIASGRERIAHHRQELLETTSLRRFCTTSLRRNWKFQARK